MQCTKQAGSLGVAAGNRSERNLNCCVKVVGPSTSLHPDGIRCYNLLMPLWARAPSRLRSSRCDTSSNSVQRKLGHKQFMWRAGMQNRAGARLACLSYKQVAGRSRCAVYHFHNVMTCQSCETLMYCVSHFKGPQHTTIKLPCIPAT